MDLMSKILMKRVNDNEIAVFWLGQAGFLIKDSYNRTITIDPYLTDCCERLAGFKRLSPKLISPGELKTDVLFASHDHPDHFDVDAIPAIMSHKITHFIGSKTTISKCLNMGIDKDRLTGVKENDIKNLEWAKFLAVYADHEDLAPDAVGVVIMINGIKIYFTGDTAYRPEKMQTAIEEKPDIIIPPINGAYGNLNEQEAAKLVRDTRAKVAIPCHFWTFAAHGGDPQQFEDAVKNIAPDTKAQFLHQGECFVHKK